MAVRRLCISVSSRAAARPATKTTINNNDGTEPDHVIPINDPESIVLYKDDDVIAINKPSGIAVHAGSKVEESVCTHLHHWQYDSPSPPNLAHRLDLGTSGVLLLSRHRTAARKLADLFQSRKIKKTYRAITVNVPTNMEGRIAVPLGYKNIAEKRNHQMHRVVLRKDKDGIYSEDLVGQTLDNGLQIALTEYKVLSYYGQRCSLIEVTTATGFKHQVRVHLADGIHCPIIGDFKFGGPLFRAVPGLRRKLKNLEISKGSPLCLHAYQIRIPDYHRNGVPLVIKAPIPVSFKKISHQLKLKIPK